MSIIDSLKRLIIKKEQFKKCGVEDCNQTNNVTTGLGQDIDKLISKSPVLVDKITKYQQNRNTIEFGEAGKGSYIIKSATNMKIVIDKDLQNNPKEILTTLAHEIGHAGYNSKYIPPDNLSENEYVSQNVMDNLKDEGEATLTNIEIKHDLKKHNGPNISIAGTQASKYEAIYKDMTEGKITREEAQEKIGSIFADYESPSTDTSKTYRDYYSQHYKDYYNSLKP